MQSSEIYQKALDKWGTNFQIIMVMEEMSELQKALIKHIRGKGNRSDIIEELADVDIMLEQMKIAFNCAEDVMIVKSEKLSRLEGLLNDD